MVIVNDLKQGMTIQEDGELYNVLNVDHNKTAMRQMIIKVKVKNLRSGVIKELNFTGGDKVEDVRVERKEMQYLYDDGMNLVFMDNNTYEQIEIPKERLEWEMKFMKPNDNVMISVFEKNENESKNAVVETGLQIKVPLFIQNGEMVVISTVTGEYSGRA